MKRYKAVFLDLCDTLVSFDSSRMSEVVLDGLTTRSTSPVVYRVFSRRHGEVSFETFHRYFAACYREILEYRERHQVEVPSPERFRRILDRLEIPRGREYDALVDEIVSAHMGEMEQCLYPPSEHRSLVERLWQEYRLALVSNFDYTPTVHAVLKRHGLIGYFEQVVVSADLGLRKPRPELFLIPCREMRLKPDEVLFVGDNFDLDVVGAKGVGMDVAWLRRSPDSPVGPQRPDYILRRLLDLEEILFE